MLSLGLEAGTGGNIICFTRLRPEVLVAIEASQHRLPPADGSDLEALDSRKTSELVGGAGPGATGAGPVAYTSQIQQKSHAQIQ
jgi:hypothetical protein